MRWFLVCVFSVQSFVAAAEESRGESRDPKDALLAAATLAEAHADARFAFSVEYRGKSKDKETLLQVRYDPRLPEGERWRLLDGSFDDLEKSAQDRIKKLESEERPDDAVVYDRIGDLIDTIELVDETDAAFIFRGPLVDDDLPDAPFEATLTLDKTEGHIERIELRALDSFKPAPVAKIKSFYQVQSFSAPTGGGPALIAESQNRVQGKAMFRSFAADVTQRFFDIERVDLSQVVAAD